MFFSVYQPWTWNGYFPQIATSSSASKYMFKLDNKNTK